MAWYRNHYHCCDCETDWDDEWSCCCDDECPMCGSEDWSPVSSDDLSFVVEQVGEEFAIFESSHLADDRPRYFPAGMRPSADSAQAFITYRKAADTL